MQMLAGACVSESSLQGDDVHPGLPMITELINKMMLHKSSLIVWSPGCADSGGEGELT